MFKQELRVVGKVVWMGKETGATKNGKNFEKYTHLVSDAKGATFIYETMIWETSKNKYSDAQMNFYNKGLDAFEDRLSDYKTNPRFVSFRVAPDKKSKIQYTTLSTYVNDDGKLSLKVSGNSFPYEQEVSIETVDEEDVVTLKSTYGDRLFSESKTSFSVQMLVKEIDENVVILTDDADDYPTEMQVEFLDKEGNPMDVEDKLEEGQGYKFNLELKKGKYVAGESADGFGFDEEAKESKGYYESNYIQVMSGGKLSGYESEGLGGSDITNGGF